MKLVYMSLPKELFYAKDYIVKFIVDKNDAPLNPFHFGSYWLMDTVERQKIRDVCNYYAEISDEVWVFNYQLCIVANGVIREIEIAKEKKIPVKYFLIDKDSQVIREAPDMYY